MNDPSLRESVAVLGAGTWGSALAGILTGKGHDVRAWDIDAQIIRRLRETRTHPRLPGFRLGEAARLTTNLAEAVEGARVILIAVPSGAVRATAQALAESRADGRAEAWLICSKGMDPETLKPLHEVLEEVLGAEIRGGAAALGGPSHAEEVVQGVPTTVVAAAPQAELRRRIQRMLFLPRFRVYTHDDLLGVELGGALKNVIAIAAGVSDGQGFGDNTRAALITRGLAEILRLGVKMGARAETFMGLSGLGDVVVTCTSRHSRNHRFGELLAAGRSAEAALAEVGMVVEGYAATRCAIGLARRHEVEMPLAAAVHAMLFEGLTVGDALEGLLAREARSEAD